MPLLPHQIDGFNTGVQGNTPFIWDCGTGKTLMALYLAKHFKGKTLVVCPKSTIESVWIEQCHEHMPELKIVSLWASTKKKRLEALGQIADIYVVNYESLKTLFKEIIDKRFTMIIIDESSKLKNPRSQITRALMELAGIHIRGSKFKTGWGDIPHRYVLTATPAPNERHEYWAQIKFITGPGNKVFDDNFYRFRDRYYNKIPLGLTGQFKFVFKTYMQEEFDTLIGSICHRVAKGEVLNLPEQIHQRRLIDLSMPETKAYQEMEKEMILELDDETIIAANALVKLMKLRQLTGGFVYDSNGEAISVSSATKLTELLNLLEEIGNHQVIIWTGFVTPENDILVYLGNKATSNYEAFKSGKRQYLIANPQSAGHGLNFQNCHYAVYYDMSYSYELHKQSQERIHRIGQDHSCIYYYLIARNTIDEVIYKVLERKAKMHEGIMKWLQQKVNSKNKS